MILTEEGEAFFHKANKLLDTIKQTSSELYDLGRHTIPIRIGIPPLLSKMCIRDRLNSLTKSVRYNIYSATNFACTGTVRIFFIS